MAKRGEKEKIEKGQMPTTASIPDAQLNAIERKKLIKLAEQLYESTHCKYFVDAMRQLLIFEGFKDVLGSLAATVSM